MMFHNLRKNYRGDRGGLAPRSPDASKFFSPLPAVPGTGAPPRFFPVPFPTLILGVVRFTSLSGTIKKTTTEYNTARNKKIVLLTVEDSATKPLIIGKKRKAVNFNNEEDVINPEDVDPSIGKFRNSCSVTIIPSKV